MVAELQTTVWFPPLFNSFDSSFFSPASVVTVCVVLTISPLVTGGGINGFQG